jgi:apolipoprotein N-acyltransferase
MRVPSLCTLLAFTAGVATVFGFAPFGAALLPFVTLAMLLLLWQDAATPRTACVHGLAFGIGLFGAGVSWVYVALNTFGEMPLPLAGIGTAAFCAYLALFPAFAGWCSVRWTAPRTWQRAIAAAGAWTVFEWARSTLFSGFGWLSLGYSQLPGSPLAGYAPAGGVFAVTLASALTAAALALAIDAFAATATRRGVAFLGSMVALSIGGSALGSLEWTSPTGAPVSISLIQGNVTQDLKFDPGFRGRTYELYSELVTASLGRLIVLPESAFPTFAGEVPESVRSHLSRTAVDRGGDVLVGMFTLDPPLPGSDEARYYNSVTTLGTADPQLYRKRHLVPFGETIPFDAVVGWFIRKVLSIPLASQAHGDADQPPLAVAGQKVAVDICYEDAFGADIRSQARDATLLVNATNDAWYGHSLAAQQHDQIAAMRALETGRPLLRATNTGITSAIAHDGREFARLPWFTRGILEVEVIGRQGVTPYVAFGDAPAVAFAALLFAAATLHRRGRRDSPAALPHFVGE